MLIYGIFWYKKYKWHKVAEEQRKIFEMVEEIIDILKKHHEECLTSPGDHQTYLAVPHVRDMLIPANRRKELYPIWDKAVEYLNENESRIRTENQCISGEEFMVWRWLQAAHGSVSCL
uniref:Man1/Src1 C-terminal domain-containing protein n=1 Tax=Romanomermis culicivorax TaxID=13658 RepID=A0A915HK14_ROMCU